jgi:hypothetical protein
VGKLRIRSGNQFVPFIVYVVSPDSRASCVLKDIDGEGQLLTLG